MKRTSKRVYIVLQKIMDQKILIMNSERNRVQQQRVQNEGVKLMLAKPHISGK